MLVIKSKFSPAQWGASLPKKSSPTGVPFGIIQVRILTSDASPVEVPYARNDSLLRFDTLALYFDTWGGEEPFLYREIDSGERITIGGVEVEVGVRIYRLPHNSRGAIIIRGKTSRNSKIILPDVMAYVKPNGTRDPWDDLRQLVP